MGYDLYVVTDEKIGRGRSHAELARQAVAGGADVVQLRDKNLSGRDLFAAALAIREITLEAGALFIVNDRLDVALASGADGVHLGAGDLPIRHGGQRRGGGGRLCGPQPDVCDQLEERRRTGPRAYEAR